MENNSNKNNSNIKDQEMEAIREMKAMNQEYLGSGEGSKAVREYLIKAGEDDALLLRFLKGRKYRPKHAWETVKRYAEVRYDQYPEAFPDSFPKECVELIENHVMGILKHRDSKGRIIGYFNASKWDPEKFPLEKLLVVAVHVVERILQHEDALNNGVVFIQECSGMGMKHAKQYTLNEMLRFMNVFWFAFPIKLKGINYVNVPYILTFLYGLIKPFFPKKLKERFLLTHTGKKFDALHEKYSKDILPKCLGGNLEDADAVDDTMLQIYVSK